MKTKFTYSICGLLFLFFTASGQAPQGLNYQAVLRDAQGTVLMSHAVSMRFTIIDSVANGTTLYQETQSITSDAAGRLEAVIGSGTVVTGAMTSIVWGVNNKFLEVEMDINAGTNYQSMGTSQLQSVPYALNALSSSQWSSSGNNIFNNNTGGNVGIGTTTPLAPLHVVGSNGFPQLEVQNPTGLTATIDLDASGGDADFRCVQNGTVNGGYGWDYTNDGLNMFIYGQPYKIELSSTTGFVGIGTATPAAELDAQGDVYLGTSSASSANVLLRCSGATSSMQSTGSGLLISGGGSASTFPQLYFNYGTNNVGPDYNNVTGLGNSSYKFTSVYATNGTIQTSDARMKTNIKTLDMGLKEVMALRPVSYDWINPAEGDRGKIGFIAQEVEKIVPQAVVHDYVSDKEIEDMKTANRQIPAIRDPYGMNYSEMIPVLTKAIQEQQALIEKLQQEVDQLRKKK